MRHRSRFALVALTSATALVLGTGAAAAHGRPGAPPSPPSPVASGLVTPLSLDVTARGEIYVAQAFAGTLTRIAKDGTRTDVVSAPASVGAVSLDHKTLTWSERVGDETAVVSAVLKRRDAKGRVTEVDILAHEATTNPDQVSTYGLQGIDEACAATIPAELAPFLLPYTGQVDANPYGSVTVRGTTYVADAGANAVFAVSPRGKVSTLAVLPPVPVTITAEAAAENGLDPCVVGLTWLVEPVPTDVEVGRHGTLYVTTLPGGVEDASLGANGAVHRIDPRTGRVSLVARGFAGATNLAIAPDGTIYVTELFAGRLSAVGKRGSIRTVAELDQPAAVEWAKGRLYVSTQVFGDGTIVTIRPRR